MIHFELIFLKGVRFLSSFIFSFACRCPVIPAPLVEKTIFWHLKISFLIVFIEEIILRALILSFFWHQLPKRKHQFRHHRMLCPYFMLVSIVLTFYIRIALFFRRSWWDLQSSATDNATQHIRHVHLGASSSGFLLNHSIIKHLETVCP